MESKEAFKDRFIKSLTDGPNAVLWRSPAGGIFPACQGDYDLTTALRQIAEDFWESSHANAKLTDGAKTGGSNE